MKIPEKNIKIKKIAGYTKNETPIVYVVTDGGLHAFFSKNKDKEIESLAAAPHRAIAMFMAEKRSPGLKWDEDFLTKGENFVDDIEKKEKFIFGKFKEVMWSPIQKSLDGLKSKFLVYYVYDKSFQVLDKAEILDGIKEGEIDEFTIVRELTLDKPATIISLHPEFKGKIK